MTKFKDSMLMTAYGFIVLAIVLLVMGLFFKSIQDEKTIDCHSKGGEILKGLNGGYGCYKTEIIH